MRRRHFLILSTAATALISQIPRLASAEDHTDKPTIALIGATSRSGREIIRQGLAAGYTIKGLARTPSKLGIEHENLEMFQGDVRDRASLENMLSGDEVVVSMVGHATPTDPMAEVGPVDIYTVMATNLIAAMKAKGNARLIMASSTGVEHRADVNAPKPAPGPGLGPKPNHMTDMWRWNARYLYNDMHEMEQMIAASGLDYILLRPGFMVEEPARGDMQFNTTNNTPGARIITYADFAAFILDHLEGPAYVNQAIGLYSDTVMNPQAEIEKFLATQKEMQKK